MQAEPKAQKVGFWVEKSKMSKEEVLSTFSEQIKTKYGILPSSINLFEDEDAYIVSGVILIAEDATTSHQLH